MTAIADFANEAAALTAGFKKLQIDRGAGKTDRFQTILEKARDWCGNIWRSLSGHRGLRSLGRRSGCASSCRSEYATAPPLRWQSRACVRRSGQQGQPRCGARFGR